MEVLNFKNLNINPSIIRHARIISSRECIKTFTKVWHVSLIYKSGKLVGWGVNKTKTSTVLKKFSYKSYSNCVHAEVVSDRSVRKMNKTNLDIIVIRISRTGIIGNSMPCAGCIEYLTQQGYKKVKYSNGEGSFCSIRLQ